MKTHPTRDPTYGRAPIHDIIKNTLLWSHTGALHNCPLSGSTQQLPDKVTEIQRQPLSGHWVLLWKSWGRVESPEEERNYTGRPTDSTNQDHWRHPKTELPTK